MTSRDEMPFGKYKGTPIKDVPEEYLDWLAEQDWLVKWPKLHLLLTKGEHEASTEKERENIDVEGELLAGQPEAFKKFWFKSYGERLRKTGEMNYIGYLRVAITTWNAAQPQQELFKRLPPPLAHIPAPNLSASVPEGNKAEKEGTPVDEDTPL